MFLSLKCYSYWCSGTIQNGLTPLTLRNTEDLAKQLGNCLQLTLNSRIGLLGERNISYVLPAHSEMLIITKKYLLGRKVTKYKKARRDVSVWMHSFKPIVQQATVNIFLETWV